MGKIGRAGERIVTNDASLYAREIATAINYPGVCPIDFSVEVDASRGSAGFSGEATIDSRPLGELTRRNKNIYDTSVGAFVLKMPVSHEHSDGDFDEVGCANGCIDSILGGLSPQVRERVALDRPRGFRLYASASEAASAVFVR